MEQVYADDSFRVAGDMTLPYVWVSLHMNAELAVQSQREAWDPREAVRFDDQLAHLCRSLRDVPAERRVALCQAAGWTAFGAAALSWCAGASFAQVCEYWAASGFRLCPGADGSRLARCLNPDILPGLDQLSGIVAWRKPDPTRPTSATESRHAPVNMRQAHGAMPGIDGDDRHATMSNAHERLPPFPA